MVEQRALIPCGAMAAPQCNRPHCRRNAPRGRSTKVLLDGIGIRIQVLAQLHAEQAAVQGMSAESSCLVQPSEHRRLFVTLEEGHTLAW
jgi:hypothetical protein